LNDVEIQKETLKTTFRLNGRLEHLTGTFADDLVERAPSLERLSKLDDFRVDRLPDQGSRWNLGCRSRTVSHGVSLCPRWAADDIEPNQITSRIRRLSSPLKEHDFRQ
jgi:hypothetical protein